MKIGIIGTGHIGSMLARKLTESGAVRPGEMIISSRDERRAKALASEIGACAGDNRAVAEQSETIILCTRLIDSLDVIDETRDLIGPEKLLVSAAFDLHIDDLEDLVGARVARALPSLTSEGMKGITLLAFGRRATDEDRRLVPSMFGAISRPVEADEGHFEVMGDLTSCGPGYIAALMQEMAIVASWRGVDRDLSEMLVLETLIGTAALLQEQCFDGLVSCVATKGGITEEGMRVIREHAPSMFGELFKATSEKHRRLREQMKLKRQGRGLD